MSIVFDDENKSNKKEGLLGKSWSLLEKPEQLSRQGLGMIAKSIPSPIYSGEPIKTVLANIPRVGVETLSETAPGFVSRGAMLTAGAVPTIRGIGKIAEGIGPEIAGQLESLSGMKPGLLTNAFKDPTLIFSRITPKARQAYKESSDLARKMSQEVANTPRPLPLVIKLLDKAKKGMITQDEALAGRQAVDQLWDSKAITENFKNMARGTFDKIAKTLPEIKESDIAFSRGKQAAGLRSLLPQNKYGGTSAFKTGIMTFLNEMGLPGKVGMAMMSPALMGTGATALGAMSKAISPLARNPRLAVVIQQLINDFVNKQQQQQGSGLP